MTSIPGPSQASSARASSVVRVLDDGVASGVNNRSLTTITRRPMGTSTTQTPGSAGATVFPARRPVVGTGGWTGWLPFSGGVEVAGGMEVVTLAPIVESHGG